MRHEFGPLTSGVSSPPLAEKQEMKMETEKNKPLNFETRGPDANTDLKKLSLGMFGLYDCFDVPSNIKVTLDFNFERIQKSDQII
jgi:hypothetical protein